MSLSLRERIKGEINISAVLDREDSPVMLPAIQLCFAASDKV